MINRVYIHSKHTLKRESSAEPSSKTTPLPLGDPSHGIHNMHADQTIKYLENRVTNQEKLETFTFVWNLQKPHPKTQLTSSQNEIGGKVPGEGIAKRSQGSREVTMAILHSPPPGHQSH